MLERVLSLGIWAVFWGPDSGLLARERLLVHLFCVDGFFEKAVSRKRAFHNERSLGFMSRQAE